MLVVMIVGVALYYFLADDDSDTDSDTDSETDSVPESSDDDSDHNVPGSGPLSFKSFSAITQGTYFSGSMSFYYHPLTSEDPTGENVLEPGSITLFAIISKDGTTSTKLVYPKAENPGGSYRSLGMEPKNNNYIPTQNKMRVKEKTSDGYWRFTHWVREFLPNSETYFVLRTPTNDSTIYTHDDDEKRSSKKYLVSGSRDKLQVDTNSTTIPSHVAVFKLTPIESVTIANSNSVNAHKLVKVECDSNSLFDNSSKKCVKIDTSMSTIGNGVRAYEKGDNYSDWPLKDSTLSNVFLNNHVTCPDGQLISDYFLKVVDTGTSNVMSIDRTCVPVSTLSSQYVGSFEVEVSDQKNYRNFANNFSINCPTGGGLQKIVYTQDTTTGNLITTYTCQKLATKNPTTRTVTGLWKQTGGTTSDHPGDWINHVRQYPQCAKGEVLSGIDMTLSPENMTKDKVGPDWLKQSSAGDAGNYARSTAKCLSHKPFLTE